MSINLLEVSAVRADSIEPLPTRWQPVDLVCHGEDEFIARTKLVRDENTAAVCVSEAVCHAILRAVGLQVAEAFAVNIGPDFAADLTHQYAFSNPIIPGRHWGTRRLQERAKEVQFSQADHLSLLTRQFDVFTIFVADALIANPDRAGYGNVLLVKELTGTGYALLVIDQSDCFNHPTCLRDPGCLTSCRDATIAEWLDGIEAVALDQPSGAARREVDRIQGLGAQLTEAIAAPPDEWYDRAGIDPATIVSFLDHRISILADLARLDHWEGLEGAVHGGTLL